MKSDKMEIQKLLAEKHAWLAELEKESDRGAALLAGAFIEHLLETLLSKKLVVDPEARGRVHFGRLTAMVNWARALGIISERVYQDLAKLGEIRNCFGHSLHGLTFDTPAIARLCNALHVPKAWKIVNPDTPRERFLTTSVFLATCLELRGKHLESPKTPEGWGMK